jgi:hypothetical protein
VDNPSPIPKPVMAIQTATYAVLEPVVVVAPMAILVAMATNPSATVTFDPIQVATRSAGTAPRTSPATSGSRRSPEP